MRRFFFTILFTGLTCGAIAAEAPATVLDCLTILQGLNEIDGKHPVIVNQGKPEEKVLDLPYEFGNGRLRGDIAHNIAVLTIVQRANGDAQQKIFADVAKGADKILPGTPEGTEYDRQMRQLTSAPCAIDGLTRIKASELKLDKNEIRAGALAAIDKIFDRGQ
jgi:hypothetical protein